MAATDPHTMPSSASPIDRHGSPVATKGRTSGRAIAALVVGVIAVLGILIPIAGIVLGIVAVALGFAVRGDARRGSRTTPWQATAGIALGGLAILASLAIIIGAVASS
ncbi:MAG: hypothetical protein HZB46_09250 [Solirubrobacterales bacterium]|nr:hypothetical protein [Solirubrobacterales bacterium]